MFVEPVAGAEAVQGPGEGELDVATLAARTPDRIIVGRNVLKAELEVHRQGEKAVAVKTYRRRPFWVRFLLGRWMTSREVRGYRAAAGIAGLPGFLGRPDAYSLAIDWVPGRSLPELGQAIVDEQVFDRVAETLQRLHARGIAFGDLHHRNVLVTGEGGVFLVDLAMVWIKRPGTWWLRNALQRRVEELDSLSLARMRARWTGRDVDEAVATHGGSIVTWHRWGRKFKTFIDWALRKPHRMGKNRRK